MGEDMTLDTNRESQPRTTRRMRIIAISVIAALLIALGIWFVGSRTAGTDRADFVHLNNQRVILDSSMNLYDPLVSKFSTRYSTAFAEEASDQDKQQVFDQETGRLKRESSINLGRLQRMESSSALDKQEVADAFDAFKREYGAVITYNDQLAINLANIARSVGGPCAAIHSKLNVAGEKYAEEYVGVADKCLAALSSAKEGSDEETTKLLSDVEALIQKQRDSAQAAVDSEDGFDRSVANIYAGLALLDINKPLTEAQTKYEADVKTKYAELVNKANKSNSEFERVLKANLDSADLNTKSEG